jgi:hypothetical protein
MKTLVFMAGCWAFGSGGREFQETWMKPEAGSMMGMARTVANGRTVFSEHMEIREENGAITMYVQLRLPGRVTPFKLTASSETEAVFSNPEHDFPQRIIYRKQDDGLFARIEGGKGTPQDFPFKRCQ